jgi:hypothetical protein
MRPILPIRLAALLALAMASACGTDQAAAPTASLPAAQPDFTGVWSGAFTTQKNEHWELEDLTACFPGCTPAARAYYASLIEDPANDAKPVQQLWGMTTAFMREELAKRSTPEGLAIQAANDSANDPNFRCVPYGLVRAAVNPLPIEIRRDGENLMIVYEEWNQSRTIYMDGRTFPADLAPTRLGYSVGRYDGDTLVIETKGVEANLYYDFQSGGGHSAEASVVERYAIADNPRRLELEMTVTDPVTLLEPHVIHKTWLFTPEVQLVEDRCGDVPGKFPEESQ